MSANNEIIIIRTKKNKWLVFDRDVDTESKYEDIGKADTLEEAVDIANEYWEKNIVEYGLKIIK